MGQVILHHYVKYENSIYIIIQENVKNTAGLLQYDFHQYRGFMVVHSEKIGQNCGL